MCNADGSEFLCMRVVNDHPLQMADGSVGYIHRPIDGTFVVPPQRRERPKKEVDWKKLMDALNSTHQPSRLEGLAEDLGVTYSSLVSLEARWHHGLCAFVFPMKNGYQELVGFRIRFDDGSKRAITGSRNALFIPTDVGGKRLWVFEGPTDTAAALTLGLNAIGRPSCNSGMFDIILLCQKTQPREVVIVADSDKVGLEGAASLSRHLPVRNCTITVPAKDMRAFCQLGGTARMLESAISSTVWCLPVGQPSRTEST
jgi:hypothetical protein